MYQIRISLLCLFSLASSLLAAQAVERNKVIVAYVYSFAKNIEWPESGETFNIQVISTNQELLSEFNQIEGNRRIAGKPINIETTRSAFVQQRIDLVYIASEFSAAVPSIYDQVRDQNILTITDGFDNQRFIMINFLSEEGESLSFEINSANIINQGLRILPDMVLLGGTDIDVAQLYREAQGSLRELEDQVTGLQRRYDSIAANIQESRDIIQKQDEQLASQNNEINNRQLIINNQNNRLDSLQGVFENSQSRLDSISEILKTTEDQFVSLRKDIFDQSSLLESGNKILEEQKTLIQEQDSSIQQRESRLQEMITRVDSQRNALVLLFAFTGVVIVFAILIYQAYRSRREDAKTLTKQKEELSSLLNELQDTQAQLVQSEKMASLGVLTAGIAHEINNAINFVYSGIHILENKFSEIKPVITKVKNLSDKDKKLKEQVEKLIREKEEIKYTEAQEVIEQMIQSIHIGAVRTTEIVKGLRTFSRADAEEMTEVDLHQDLEVALLLLHSKHKDAFEIKTIFGKGIPKISGFQGQLGQAFLNIISNAIDAVSSKGEKAKITIKTTKSKDSVIVSIKDNGIGMPQEMVDKIFDPFYTTKKVGSGTGLGLSITYGIIEKHQGNITVTSSPNAGAEFIITLPLDKKPINQSVG